MASKQEIKEWLEHCGAEQGSYIAYVDCNSTRIHIWCIAHLDSLVDSFCLEKTRQPLHLLNPELTGIQGPTFAEWKKQKGREGKVQKIMEAFEEAYKGYMWPTVAEKILDAIEEEGE